jgi:hypothetical protein
MAIKLHLLAGGAVEVLLLTICFVTYKIFSEGWLVSII